MSASKHQVLFISGYGRSGSTLLERVLSQSQAVTATGEICHIWNRGFGQDQLCGCESPFSKCSFWMPVAEEFGRGGFDPKLCDALQMKVARFKDLPRVIYPRLRSREFESDISNYQLALSHLYDAIASKADTDSKLIIDSSKDPVHGLILASLPNIDLHVLHLIRDSRGVAYSWMRKRVRPEIAGDKALMPVFSPTRSSLVWTLKNFASELLRKRARSYTRVRYEDLISAPAETIEAVAHRTGLGELSKEAGKLRENVVTLGVDHTCAGNPMRFKQGELKLKLDNTWRTQMATFDRRYVTMLTFPWLWKYGYLK